MSHQTKALTFDRVRLLLGEADRAAALLLRENLHTRGFRIVIPCPTVESVVEHLNEGGADVLVGDLNLPGGSLASVVRDMRHGTVGDNPFVITLATLGTATTSMVAQAVDAGVDDILARPLQFDTLMDRLSQLAEKRQPFVVTHDYIGPDRRRRPRPKDSPTARQIAIPNPLHCKTHRHPSACSLKSQVNDAVTRVNLAKIDCGSLEMSFLLQRILRGCGDIEIKPTVAEDLLRLPVLLGELRRRSVGTPYAELDAQTIGLLEPIESLQKTLSRSTGALADLIRLGRDLRQAYQAVTVTLREGEAAAKPVGCQCD